VYQTKDTEREVSVARPEIGEDQECGDGARRLCAFQGSQGEGVGRGGHAGCAGRVWYVVVRAPYGRTTVLPRGKLYVPVHSRDRPKKVMPSPTLFSGHSGVFSANITNVQHRLQYVNTSKHRW
jgi:hypothetical protein